MNDRDANVLPVELETSREDSWRRAARIAAIGIFVLLLGAFLYIARTLVAPIVAAATVAFTFGPLAVRAARYRVPPSIFALSSILLGLLAINTSLVLLGGLVADWTARAPEFAKALSAKAYLLE